MLETAGPEVWLCLSLWVHRVQALKAVGKEDFG